MSTELVTTKATEFDVLERPSVVTTFVNIQAKAYDLFTEARKLRGSFSWTWWERSFRLNRADALTALANDLMAQRRRGATSLTAGQYDEKVKLANELLSLKNKLTGVKYEKLNLDGSQDRYFNKVQTQFVKQFSARRNA